MTVRALPRKRHEGWAAGQCESFFLRVSSEGSDLIIVGPRVPIEDGIAGRVETLELLEGIIVAACLQHLLTNVGGHFSIDGGALFY